MIIKPNNNGGGRQVPDRIIIHSIGEYIIDKASGEEIVYHASDYLEKIKLSAHYLIQPDGDVIQCRKPDLIAWHALGDNRDTIGIEVLIEGEHNYNSFLERIKEDWVKPIQMKNLIILINNLCTQYRIKKIERHSDIDPERKYDPGTGFNWGDLLEKIKL